MESTQLRVASTYDAPHGRGVPYLGPPKILPLQARVRRVVLNSALYQNILDGHETVLFRPIMSINGELRPLATRARGQGGDGGLLWAFVPPGSHAEKPQLRSCPYGDPGDQLLITTSDEKDLPLSVTVEQSFPHRVLGTTNKFLKELMPSQWGRLADTDAFFDHWQATFGRVFKLTDEPWVWIIHFEPPEPPAPTAAAPALAPPPVAVPVSAPAPVVEAPPAPEAKRGLFGRWRDALLEKQQASKAALETTLPPQQLPAVLSTTTLPPAARLSTTLPPATLPAEALPLTTLPPATLPRIAIKKRGYRQLLASHKNAMACLENAIEADREGRAGEALRLMNVAYRVLQRATERTEPD